MTITDAERVNCARLKDALVVDVGGGMFCIQSPDGMHLQGNGIWKPASCREYVFRDWREAATELRNRRALSTDLINHPPHYTHGKIEPIDVIADWKLGFCDGSALKYIARWRHKGDGLNDLKKARWYIDRLIEEQEFPRE